MKKDYLREYLCIAPASLALVRAIECRLLENIEFKHPILDIGCGDGVFASVFFNEDIEQGIDISTEEIERAKKTNKYSNLLIADANDLPFENGSFSTVFSNCVLEHIPQIDDVLKEISRLLKTDGSLIFTVPSDSLGNNLFFSYVLNKVGLSKLSSVYSDKTNEMSKHYNLFNLSTWENKLKQNGLKIVTSITYLSPRTTKIYDIMAYTGILSKFTKKLAGRWILSQGFRKYFIVPVLSLLLRKHYESNFEQGSSLIIVARKM